MLVGGSGEGLPKRGALRVAFLLAGLFPGSR
jgi:hypothetical protein